MSQPTQGPLGFCGGWTTALGGSGLAGGRWATRPEGRPPQEQAVPGAMARLQAGQVALTGGYRGG
jgi:hypothetical protein